MAVIAVLASACSGGHSGAAKQQTTRETRQLASTTVAPTTSTAASTTTTVAATTILPPPPPPPPPPTTRAPRVVVTTTPPTTPATPTIDLPPRGDDNIEIHDYDGIITGSVAGDGGGFNVWARCHGGTVRVIVDAFTPPPKPMGYWYLGVSVNDSQLLFNGKAYIGQVITGTGTRVRLFSQTVADDYRIEYHC